jgi:hypothetical protein
MPVVTGRQITSAHELRRLLNAAVCNASSAEAKGAVSRSRKCWCAYPKEVDVSLASETMQLKNAGTNVVKPSDTVMGGYRLTGSRIHRHGAETARGRRGRY